MHQGPSHAAGTWTCALKKQINMKIDRTREASTRDPCRNSETTACLEDTRPLQEGILLTVSAGEKSDVACIQKQKDISYTAPLSVARPTPGAVQVREPLKSLRKDRAKVSVTTPSQAEFYEAMQAIKARQPKPPRPECPRLAISTFGRRGAVQGGAVQGGSTIQRPADDCSQFGSINTAIEHCKKNSGSCHLEEQSSLKAHRFMLAQGECAKGTSKCVEDEACLYLNIRYDWNTLRFKELCGDVIHHGLGIEAWKHGVKIAARFGRDKHLSILLDDDFGLAESAKTVSAADRFQEKTALTLASQHGHKDCVLKLLAHGDKLRKFGKDIMDAYDDTDGYNALLWATSNGDLEIVQKLMERFVQEGAQLPRVKTHLTVTRLKINVEESHPEDGLGGNDLGENVLEIAVYKGHENIVKHIMTKWLDAVNDIRGHKQPLMYAAETGRTNMVNILMPKMKDKARINDKDEKGKTALLYTLGRETGRNETELKNSADIAQILLQSEYINNSINVVANDGPGYHAINYAVDKLKEAKQTGQRQAWEDIVTRIADLMATHYGSMNTFLKTERSRAQNMAAELGPLVNRRTTTQEGGEGRSSPGQRPLQPLLDEETTRKKTCDTFDANFNLYGGARSAENRCPWAVEAAERPPRPRPGVTEKSPAFEGATAQARARRQKRVPVRRGGS